MIGVKKTASNEVAVLMKMGNQRTQGLLFNVPKRYYQL